MNLVERIKEAVECSYPGLPVEVLPFTQYGGFPDETCTLSYHTHRAGEAAGDGWITCPVRVGKRLLAVDMEVTVADAAIRENLRELRDAHSPEAVAKERAPPCT